MHHLFPLETDPVRHHPHKVTGTVIAQVVHAQHQIRHHLLVGLAGLFTLLLVVVLPVVLLMLNPIL